MHYPVRMEGVTGRRRNLRAVDGVSFSIAEGEALGLVGESGCGKSTVAKLMMRLLTPTSGRVAFMGRDITELGRREMRPLRRNMQIVFQDPFASLNAGMKAGDIVAEPLLVHEGRRPEAGRVLELFELVGLHPGDVQKYPHEFSGAQRQWISIARALALRPKLLVLDEPVSALDVSIQAQIINLLIELKQSLGLAYLFIAHDLSVVRHVCEQVAVMYLGKIVEWGDREQVFSRPCHPYTQALVSATRIKVEGIWAPIRSSTERPDTERPRSPCTSPSRYSPNWTNRGRLRPNASRICSCCSGENLAPPVIIADTASPGTSCMIKKIRMAAPTSTGMVKARRPKMYFSTACSSAHSLSVLD